MGYTLTKKKDWKISGVDFLVREKLGTPIDEETFQIGAKNAYLVKVKYIDEFKNSNVCAVGVSYRTPVALKAGGKMYITPYKYSSTTSRHLPIICTLLGGSSVKQETSDNLFNDFRHAW